jgi:hypothetical protein
MRNRLQTPGTIMRHLQNSRPDIGDVRVSWVQESQEFVAKAFPSSAAQLAEFDALRAGMEGPLYRRGWRAGWSVAYGTGDTMEAALTAMINRLDAGGRIDEGTVRPPTPSLAAYIGAQIKERIDVNRKAGD